MSGHGQEIHGMRIVYGLLASIVCFAATAQEPSPIPIQPADRYERFDGDLIRNFYNLYQPCVIEVPDEAYPFRMWFFGWAADESNSAFAGSDAIFHARSRDLKTWEVYAGDGEWDTAMDPKRWHAVVSASDKRYDECHNGDPSVAYKDGKFYLGYSATSWPNYRPNAHGEAAMLCCIMGAVSDDGIHWTKTDQPILIESEEAQKAQDVTGHYVNFLRPSLHWDAERNRWRMWFDYYHPTKGVCMGYAENTGDFTAKGGFVIQHDLAEPVLERWVNPDVVYLGDRYYAFADPSGYPVPEGIEGSNWRARTICEAQSKDGLHWEVIGFILPDDDAAACHVPQALITEHDGKPWLYVFYSTQRGGTETLGIYDFRYDRIRAKRRPLE